MAADEAVVDQASAGDFLGRILRIAAVERAEKLDPAAVELDAAEVADRGRVGPGALVAFSSSGGVTMLTSAPLETFSVPRPTPLCKWPSCLRDLLGEGTMPIRSSWKPPTCKLPASVHLEAVPST